MCYNSTKLSDFDKFVWERNATKTSPGSGFMSAVDKNSAHYFVNMTVVVFLPES